MKRCSNRTNSIKASYSKGLFLFAFLFALSPVPALATVGDSMVNTIDSVYNTPGILTTFAYLFGLVCAFFAILKTKEHVENPNQVTIWEPIKRFVAGGAFFALPIVSEAALNTITGNGVLTPFEYTGWSGSTAGGNGLDEMLVALIRDIWRPMHGLITVFAYLAGLILVIIGISRMLKSEQDGARGPGGFGTIMTFLVAGCLFSIDALMGAFSDSIFGEYQIVTFANLQIGSGDTTVDNHLLAVISGALGFMVLVGWVSFLRGFFILRDVAEGNGQASLMAAITHMIGGVLAVNLGPLLNAVQSTFGLTAYGVAFS